MGEQGWDEIIEFMQQQRVSELNAEGRMTDDVLDRISRLDHVTYLNLDGSDALTDDGLLHLARMPQLQELDLSGWHSQITDRGLEVLKHLPALRKFQMCWPQRVTDAGLANLAFCDQLERVDLLGTPTGDGVVRALAGKPRLSHFKTGNQVTDDGLALLHEFPVFKSWQGREISMTLLGFDAEPNHLLVRGSFTDRGIAKLVGLDGLFGLNLDARELAITAECLKPLAQLPNLGWLGFDATDDTMPFIAALPHLRFLMCQDTAAGDDGFTALSHSQTIEYIWGRRCHNLTARGFAALSAMPALRALSVSCKNVDDAGLSALPNFPALRELMPMDVSDEGYVHIGRCAELESLVLMYCRETGDAATEHIFGLSRLKNYFASYNKITDRTPEILGSMLSLERIEFSNCPSITNAGLASLAGLPRLREVRLSGLPKVSDEGVTVFPAHVRVHLSHG